MLVSVKWLKEYVDIERISNKELADRVTMSGSHVDSIDELDKGVQKVVVGKIKEINPHPDADKLVVTKVDVGTDMIQIVTGANNIKVGDYVPIALVGARLTDGMKISKSKLRGVESYGMMCSAKELGINEDFILKDLKNGIFILDREYPLGCDIKEVMGLKDVVIDFEITPNRPDCLSIVGMARETAATFGKEFKFPIVEIKNEVEDISNYVNNITVEDNELCRRYYARVVKDVDVKPSPLWLRRKLSECGLRPINNIVDITNYVMLELGQPLHAFDLDHITDKTVIIRKAVEGEKIKTLDDVNRNLDNSMLTIADTKKPIAIAGVMGGLDSEVNNNSKTILIESANFKGRSVRLTSRTLGLRTDASSRFEKDLDPNLSEIACNRVCQLIEQIGAGTIIKGSIDIYDNVKKEKIIYLRPERANMMLDVEISPEKMVKILNTLELHSKFIKDKIEVTVPTFRNDIELEADLIEEIARIYGFDKIKSVPLVGTLTKGEKSTQRTIEDKIKNILVGVGLNEITTYSFVSPKVYNKINLPEDSIQRKYVELINPLGEDYSVMRTTLIPNMMDVLTRNYNYGVEECFAFEIGNLFKPTSLPVKSLPKECKTLCIGMYGNTDYFDIKGIMDTLLSRLGIHDCEYIREERHNTFHSGRTANIIKNNHLLGIIGEIHPDVRENYGIKERVYTAEIDLETIIIFTNFNKKYKELPKYPATTRDIALVVDENSLVKDIEKIIWTQGKDLVEEIKLFDVYTGDQIPQGKKSIAYSIVYRSREKTLTDEEVTKVHDKIVNDLIKDLNASLRQ